MLYPTLLIKIISLLLIIIIQSSTSQPSILDLKWKPEHIETAANIYLAKKNSSFKFEMPDFNLSDDERKCFDSVKHWGSELEKFLTTCKLKKEKASDLDCLEPNWAIKIADIFPMKPTGLLRKGPFFFMGDYDMCKEISAKDEAKVHYCTIKGSLSIDFSNKMKEQEPPFTFGLCLPSACGEKMLHNLLNYTTSKILNGGKNIIHMDSVDCKPWNDSEWEKKKPFVITFGFFVVGVIILGTIFEKFQNKGVIRMRKIRSVKSGKHIPLTEPCGDGDDENEIDNDNRSDRTSKNEFSEAVDDCSSMYQGPNPMVCAPSIALTYRSSPPNLSKWSAYTIFIEIITSFSLTSSFNYLFRNSTREVRLINGIRVITSFWVTFSHTCLFSLQFTDTVRSLAESATDSTSGGKMILSSFMLNSSLSVDTFLFVSACVATFSIRKRMMFRASEQFFSLKRASAVLIHRVLRLFPALCLYLAFMSLVYNHLGDGPFWNTEGMFGSICNASSIWPHFLFLSNFSTSYCVPWLWHIALDFQLYLIFPMVFWVLSKWRFGWVTILVLTVVSLVYRSLIYGFFTLPMNMFVEMLSGKFEKVEMSFRLLYTSPISRAPPFLIGILTGWFICRPVQGPPMKWITRTSILSFAMILLAVALFGPISSGPIFGYSHAVVHRTLWSVGIAIIVFMAQNGYSGLIGFLSDPRFVVMSRLSFGVFLSHEPIVLYYLNTLRQPISPNSFGHFLFISISIYFISLLFALLIAVVVEIPLVTMERKFLMKTSEPEPADMSMRRRNSSRRVSFSKDLEIGMDEMQSDEKTRHWLEKNPLGTPYHDVHHLQRLNLDSEESPTQMDQEKLLIKKEPKDEDEEIVDERLSMIKSKLEEVSESSA